MRARTVRRNGKDLHFVRSAFRQGAGLAAIFVLLNSPLRASTWDTLPLICERAAVRAANESGVPLSVLRAISLTETGRTKNGAFRPWPWTVNMEGKGRWFDTLDEARAYVTRHHERGARSYDVGCFQINFRWHGQHFDSPLAMFDPDANAAYAARFLGELYAEFGDWSRAAGAYHSRTPEHANRYRARFDRIRARLSPDGKDEAAVAVALRPADAKPVPPPSGNTAQSAAPRTSPAIRDNRFPLLISTGAPRGLGSLVPLEIVTTPLLVERGGR